MASQFEYHWIDSLRVGDEVVERATARRYRVRATQTTHAFLEQVGGDGERARVEWHVLRNDFLRAPPTEVTGGRATPARSA